MKFFQVEDPVKHIISEDITQFHPMSQIPWRLTEVHQTPALNPQGSYRCRSMQNIVHLCPMVKWTRLELSLMPTKEYQWWETLKKNKQTVEYLFLFISCWLYYCPNESSIFKHSFSLLRYEEIFALKKKNAWNVSVVWKWKGAL